MHALAASLSLVLSIQAEGPPPRLLLFAAGPTREYQFCRNLFIRDQEKRQVHLTICLQGVDPAARQDVPADRLLSDFPQRLEDFDLILAIDPNWSRLTLAQRQELEAWLKKGGGLVLVAGPLFTRQLTDVKLGAIRDLYPVEIDEPKDRSTQLPWRLRFHDKERPPFVKLDATEKDSLAGWDGFFGETGKPPPPEPDLQKVDKLVGQLDSNDFEVRQRAQEELEKMGRAGIRQLEKLMRDKPPLEVRIRAEQVLAELRKHDNRHGGFYDCHPVKTVKPKATVVAAFADPEAKQANSQECPFLVTMPYGQGKVVYLGSGETWRLRQYREAYHERFWREVVKYVGDKTRS